MKAKHILIAILGQLIADSRPLNQAALAVMEEAGQGADEYSRLAEKTGVRSLLRKVAGVEQEDGDELLAHQEPTYFS